MVFRFKEKNSFVLVNLVLILCLLLAAYSPVIYYIQKINEKVCGANVEILFWINLSDMILSILTPFVVMVISTCLTTHSLIKNKIDKFETAVLQKFTSVEKELKIIKDKLNIISMITSAVIYTPIFLSTNLIVKIGNFFKNDGFVYVKDQSN